LKKCPTKREDLEKHRENNSFTFSRLPIRFPDHDFAFSEEIDVEAVEGNLSFLSSLYQTPHFLQKNSNYWVLTF